MTPIETAVSELPATELEAIKQRCDAAFAGPWITGDKFGVIYGLGGMGVAKAYSDDDAAFVAESRTDIPKLLTEIERLRKLESQGLYPRLAAERDALTAELASAKAERDGLLATIKSLQENTDAFARELFSLRRKVYGTDDVVEIAEREQENGDAK